MADKLIIRSNSRTLPNPLFTESFDSFSFKPSSSKFSRYSKPRSYGSYESSKPSTSPTIPKTSPSFKESDKLLTANIRPSSVSNSTFKLLISNKFVI